MKIVTDSTVDLPKEIIEEYNIDVVPLTVRLGDRVLRDYYDLSPTEFFKMLHETDDFPTTSQPSVEEFLNAYRKLGDKEKVISIHISSRLSATCQAADIALQQLQGWDIKIVDSQTTSVGLGIMVLEVAKAVKAGAEAEDIMKLIEKLKSMIKVYFSVDSLEHLQRGGRIGRAQAFVGGMLKVKPLLAITDGMVTPMERIRGGSKLISRMVELVKMDAGENSIVKAGFIWGESQEQVSELIDHIKNAVRCEELFKGNIGSVITSHAGPTAFGIGYYCVNSPGKDSD